MDRAGSIRVINGIPAFKSEFDRKNRGLARTRNTSPEDLISSTLHKPKLNIFEAQDPQVQKIDTL